MKVEFYRHSLGSAEGQSVAHALEGLFLTAGPLTRKFEEKFAQYLNCQRVVGTYSCTTALFLCLKALEIGHGDEVITTPMTFIATANVILEAGAVPVFADVEDTTGNINAELIENAITAKTKAIIAVHLYGHLCDMKKINDIARRHGLFLIEDTAHCVEGERDGIRPGSFSDAACFSFYATKNMTSGEGGAVATNNESLAEKLILLRSHGMNKEAADRYNGKYRHWDMVCMGYKGNMFDIQAALLLPQIPELENKLKKRQEIFNKYVSVFSDMDGVEFPITLSGTKHACHLFTIWVNPDKRDDILNALQEEGIGVAVNYRPVHLLTYYRKTFGYKEESFPVAEMIGKRTISLPLYPNMGEDAVGKVIEAVQKSVR
ncbi:DegT/DnrJ/EryC1/StrS family aminotransferase [Desulfonema magnum]|uniref:DegT/DnrJ/EryC1/StrS aminotransferase domain-containing protein n=1 Tax=Desulfonema magnum TaxID=45655 RepID=A0A975BEY7_9BACT|nr:DegT/DnrJ/EryC1/StrS family aminotransferase [Desulfonema magnum]QTA84484.1 DegT/DnrJ/EryC1/StrS aminotransferase domain-containing protein [Desulfonema magnum]